MRRIQSLFALCVVGLASPHAMGQAAAEKGRLTANDLVGTWEMDRDLTVRRSVENAPENDKERVKAELEGLLPQQVYAFAADGTYKVQSTSGGRNVEDAGTFKLAADKLTLTSTGAAGTRSLDLTRDKDNLLLGGQLILSRTTPDKLTAPPKPAAAPRPAERKPAAAEDQAVPPRRANARASVDQTAMAGTKGDKTLQTAISRTDMMTGFVFEMTADGSIANIRSASLKQSLPEKTPNQLVVTGQPGYVLHGVYVDAKERVNAMCLEFVRIGDDQRLVLNDTYKSEWIGKATNEKPITLGCNGKSIGGFTASKKDGLLRGVSLRMSDVAAEAANAPAATPAKRAQNETFVAMMSEAATIVESVTDAPSAKQARERLDALAKQNQNIGGMNTVTPDRIDPLMQRIDKKLKSIRQTLPDESRALQTSMRDLLMGAATPQERAAANEGQKQIAGSIKLKQLAVAIKMREADGKPAPATLDELVKDGSITADVLDSPMGDAKGGDFVYIRPSGDAQEAVLLYDAAALSAAGGTNVAFTDGSVQWQGPDQLRALKIPRSK